jgi:hypothetical protein
MDTLFIQEVRAGRRTAWRKIKRARNSAKSQDGAARSLGISPRTYYGLLADVEGLRAFCDGEGK